MGTATKLANRERSAVTSSTFGFFRRWVVAAIFFDDLDTCSARAGDFAILSIGIFAFSRSDIIALAPIERNDL